MEKDKDTLLSTLGDLWKHAVDRGRYDDALIISVLAYLESRAKGDKTYTEGAVSLISESANHMLGDSASKHVCSFCGRRPPQVKLTGGVHNGYICNACVDTLYADLHGSDAKKD